MKSKVDGTFVSYRLTMTSRVLAAVLRCFACRGARQAWLASPVVAYAMF